jgi:hypothetical protein
MKMKMDANKKYYAIEAEKLDALRAEIADVTKAVSVMENAFRHIFNDGDEPWGAWVKAVMRACNAKYICYNDFTPLTEAWENAGDPIYLPVPVFGAESKSICRQ